jgi:betaine reductase
MRVVHYLNQFFGQLGGEEAAAASPQIKQGPIGPGRALALRLGTDFQIVATAICGDNAIADSPGQCVDELLDLLAPYRSDLLIAGPCFNAGRFGQGAGELCAAAQERLHIPAIAAMHEDNPAADQFRDRVLIVRTGASAAQMAPALDGIASVAKRIAAGESLDRPADVGCLPRGLKRPVVREFNAARRVVDMLLDKLHDRPFVSEISVPLFDRVPSAKIDGSLHEATVAIVTDGGLIARGNPEKMPNGFTDRMTAIPIASLERLSGDFVEVHHGGYDTRFVNDDPNRLVPLDALRDLEKRGSFGKLYEIIFSTAGLGMSLSNAKRLGKTIGERLRNDGVQAVILTST